MKTKILSIETSCDDTGISLLEAEKLAGKIRFKILANASNSQVKIHAPYGGVFPMLAKREHQKNLPILLEEILKGQKTKKDGTPDIDLIAVTAGPGLEPALWTGIVFAQELFSRWKIPVIPVNHMEGHIVSVFAKVKKSFLLPLDKKNKLNFPILSLLVSGGHTELVLSKKWGDYKIIGETLDDAAGEAFDKVARMLGLPYPGGPEISRLAEEIRGLQKKREKELNFLGTPQDDGPRTEQIFQQKNYDPKKFNSFSLPRPMIKSKDFNFSFSGLKTAVLYLIRKISPEGTLSEETKREIALEFENSVIECLLAKTLKASQKYKIKTLIISGGVSANKYLRNETQKMIKVETKNKIKLFFPEKELSTDNAIMIGMAGYLNYIKNRKTIKNPSSIKASGNMRF